MHGSTIILIKSDMHSINIQVIREMTKKWRSGQPRITETLSGHCMLSIKDKFLY